MTSHALLHEATAAAAGPSRDALSHARYAAAPPPLPPAADAGSR